MLTRKIRQSAVRGRVAPWALVVLVALAPAAGCKHRRSAYRPAFINPPSAVVVPEAPCAGCDPAPAIAPGFEDGLYQAAPAAPSILAPGESTVAPPAGGEPYLDPGVVPQGSEYAPTSASPALEPPRETRDTDPATRATLRSRVQALANDPVDLFEPPKADRPWQYIVLHHSASPEGSYGAIDRAHREHLGTAGCGYHFVIGNGSLSPDGQIEVTQRWSDQKAGAHCRDARTPDVNEYGIGICLVGDLDSSPPTPRQVEAAQALVAYLGARYEIPTNRIGSHAQIAQNPTACPGKHFPAEAILGGRSLAAAR